MIWRSPLLLVVAAVVLLVGGGVYLATASRHPAPLAQHAPSPSPRPTTNPLSTTPTARSLGQRTPPPAALPTFAATPVLKAVIGVAPPLTPVSNASPLYTSSALGVSFRYPAGWTYVEHAHPPQYDGVTFYPPGADRNAPGPTVDFDFNAHTPYDASSPVPPYMTPPTPVSVAGVTGRQYASVAYAVPDEGYVLQFPQRGGTLSISTTEGPNVNLVPQLQAMLKSLILQP